MIELSRYCIPYTPLKKVLGECRIMLLTTAAVRRREQEPFRPEGDSSFRAIDYPVSSGDLAYDDTHYDHGCVDADLNCVFPIDRLTALAEEGAIAGVAPLHFSLGYSQALRDLRENTFPRLVKEVDAVRPDAVLLTGG